MQVETLDDLKARNAKEEADAKAAVKPEAEEEVLADDQAADDSDPDGQETKQEGESAEEGDEAWMKADEAGDDKQQKSVPLASHVGMRTKLKDKVKEKDGEIEKLRLEIEALKKQPSQVVTSNAPVTQDAALEIPDPLDFKTTADYKAAMANYIADAVQRNSSLVGQTNSAKQRQDELLKRQESAVESHCKRAQELVTSYGISPDMYRQKEMKVREAIESVFPSGGDAITDSLIEHIGEGSEKVMYFLGNNESARSTLIGKLAEDKSGVKASIYLGKILAERASASPVNRSSSAPNPAVRIKGGMKAPSADEAKLKKQYADAHKRGDIQAAFDAKQAAKVAGVNVKSW